MKSLCSFCFFLLLVLLSGQNLEKVGGANVIRPPEHTCHISIGSGKCDAQKCMQACLQESNGRGECRDATCFCSYYCHGPPL